MCVILLPRYTLGENRGATTPTTTESTLPWKREDDKEDNGVIQQTEFPAWANNKEYLAYNSPSATFLGKSLLYYTYFLLKNRKTKLNFCKRRKKKNFFSSKKIREESKHQKMSCCCMPP